MTFASVSEAVDITVKQALYILCILSHTFDFSYYLEHVFPNYERDISFSQTVS
jgi:hypothetical protein